MLIGLKLLLPKPASKLEGIALLLARDGFSPSIIFALIELPDANKNAHDRQ
jgi:hypothetical protein